MVCRRRSSLQGSLPSEALEEVEINQPAARNDVRHSPTAAVPLGIAEGMPQQKSIDEKGPSANKLHKLKSKAKYLPRPYRRRWESNVSTTKNDSVADERISNPKETRRAVAPNTCTSSSISNTIYTKGFPKDASETKVDPAACQTGSYTFQNGNSPPLGMEKEPRNVAGAFFDDYGQREGSPVSPTPSSHGLEVSPEEDPKEMKMVSAHWGSSAATPSMQTNGLSFPRPSNLHAVRTTKRDSTQSITIDSSDDQSLEVAVNLVLHDDHGKLLRRKGMMDTGSAVDAISCDVVYRLGKEMDPWEGDGLTSINGYILPIGQVTLDWHVYEFGRTYTTSFAVLDANLIPDFDVLLGIKTIRDYKLLMRNKNVCFLSRTQGTLSLDRASRI